MAATAYGPIWLNTREDPTSLVVGKLRRVIRKLKPGARTLTVRTQRPEAVDALQDWCREHNVFGRTDRSGDAWRVTLYLLPDTLGGRFEAPASAAALEAA